MEITLSTRGGPASASVHGEGATALVLSHGAGGTRRQPWLVAFAEDLAARGRRVILHNFPYSEAGRKLPDRPPALEDTVAAAVARAREMGATKVVAGGRSMGGRMASMAAASGLPVDGLLLVAYPLHPPGAFDKQRVAHLPAIRVPTLFVHGTRDEFARADLFSAAVATMGGRATVHTVDGGDHSFALPRGSGRPVREVRAGIVEAVEHWLIGHGL
jgi:predicted alpha/beta-hydrolase family hydrolase